MALLEWKDKYSVGIEAVDHEHRELIELINRLHEEATARGSKEAIEAFFGDLLKNISMHFALEERFMREHRYDQMSQHKTEHERLLDDLREIMDGYIGMPSAAAELGRRLDNWFSRHFETHDARLHRRLGSHPT